MGPGLKISDQRNRLAAGLVLIALISAVPRLLLGASQFIEYDGYWHVFIAQQDRWSNFWEDIRVNAHPPLYFLLLKFVIHFGRTLLVYRAISLVTGIISIFSVGWLARKVTHSEIWAYIAALAYGLAMPAIIVSCEVRSYMLSSLFILLSFTCLLELATTQDSKRELKLRAGFAFAAILACLSHYYAFFYVGASTLLLAVWYGARKLRHERASWRAELATILPVLGAVAILYETHARLKAGIQGHLLPFYYDPNGAESIAAFLTRNWKNTINLFLPWQISSNAAALAIFAVAAAGGIALLAIFLRARDAADTRAAWTILVTAATLAGIAVMAVRGKYPFGGDLRQQFILFPFFVLCAAAAADWLTRRIPWRAQLALGAAIAIAVAWVSTLRYEQYPKISENVLQSRMDLFNRVAPDPAGVYVDQWNLITFFVYHHDWKWTSLAQQPIPGITIYRISHAERHMLVFRDDEEWNVRPENDGVYNKLAKSLRAGKIPEVSVFEALQSPPDAPFSDFGRMRRGIVNRAAAADVCVQRLSIDPVGWYGSFRRSGCTAPALKPPRVTGTFDDTSEEIDFSGPWTHGSFPLAAGGTSSYSNVPGATARLTFEGTSVTWVYAKAFNRGFASVRIDGIPRNDVDLYSPGIAWQSSTTYSGLAPGSHTLELMVAGRKDAPAKDSFVDIDALVVK